MKKEVFENILGMTQELGLHHSLEEMIDLIAEGAKGLMGAERCSVFIVDKAAEILWTEHSDGIGRIAISLNAGITGETYLTRKPQLVNDPYSDPRFIAKIDRESGFKTRNILTAPIFNSRAEAVGVIQLLNKEEGEFDQDDMDRLVFFMYCVGSSVELALME